MKLKHLHHTNTDTPAQSGFKLAILIRNTIRIKTGTLATVAPMANAALQASGLKAMYRLRAHDKKLTMEQMDALLTELLGRPKDPNDVLTWNFTYQKIKWTLFLLWLGRPGDYEMHLSC